MNEKRDPHTPKTPTKTVLMDGFWFEKLKVGAYLLSPLRSTIGGSGLNFRVRNENGCTPTPKAPTLNFSNISSFASMA
jgi:hypothetical protein